MTSSLLSIIFTGAIAGWIAYALGYRRGYQAGARDEQGKSARRFERMKRFYEPNNH